MSFTGAFTKTNDTATAYNAFIIEDTSNYADEPKNTFSGRKIYLVYIDGSYVTAPDGNDYFDFPFDDGDTKLINALTADAALNVYVVWDSLDPQQGSTYTKSNVYDFVDYIKSFMCFTGVASVAANRLLNWPAAFYEGMSIMQAFIDTSANSIVNNDQYESQQAINLATTFYSNLNNFY